MSCSKKHLEWFMARGRPREKFFLRWDGYDSFCDAEVQRVLLQIQPQDYYAIDAWKAADGFALSSSQFSWWRLLPFMQQNPLWCSELLAAVLRYYRDEAERSTDPQNPLASLKRWRAERYLRETSIFPRATHKEAVKHNTLLKKAMKENRKWKRGAPPVPIQEAPKPATNKTGYLDGNRPKWILPGTYRSAMKRENDRRDKIMGHWAECFIASSVTKPPHQK